MKRFAAGQIIACAFALGVCVFLPKRNSDVLLVPIGAKRPVQALDFARGDDVSIIAAGRVPGSIVVRSRRALSLVALLRQGVVAIAVPPFLCGRNIQDRS